MAACWFHSIGGKRGGGGGGVKLFAVMCKKEGAPSAIIGKFVEKSIRGKNHSGKLFGILTRNPFSNISQLTKLIIDKWQCPAKFPDEFIQN